MAKRPFTKQQLLKHLQELQARWPTGYWLYVTQAEFLSVKQQVVLGGVGSIDVCELNIPIAVEPVRTQYHDEG